MIRNKKPYDYNIAIRKDGEVFRVSKDIDISDDDDYAMQYGNKPCAFRHRYFNVHGRLRKQFWELPEITI